MKIRDIIYLDNSRMYSLYSQIFDGIADTSTNTYYNKNTTDNSIKKANSQVSSLSEESLTEIGNKIMYDNLYNKLEEKLSDVIINFYKGMHNYNIELLNDAFIIKIIGNANIYDSERYIQYTDSFNKIGDIIAESIYNTLENKQNSSIKKIATEKKLNLENNILKNLKYITEFFNKDGLDVVIKPDIIDANVSFRGVLKREYLRIKENILRQLYSSETTMEWIMVGQVTFLPNKIRKNEIHTDSNNSYADSFENMMHSLNNVEASFSESKACVKIHIAPIAIYVEKELNIEK